MYWKKYLNWQYLYLLIFLIPLLYNPWGGASPFELTKQSFFVFLVGVVLVFFAVFVLNKNSFFVWFNKWVFSIVALFLLSYVLSFAFSIAPIESFWGTYNRMQGLFAHIYYAAHFMLCLQLFRSEDLKKKFFSVTIFCGILLSGYAILQFFSIDPLRSVPADLFAGRSFATMGHPNDLGQFLIFPFFVSLFYILYFWKKNKRFSVLNVLFLVLIGFAILTTRNRATILAILISALLFGVLNVRVYWKKILIVLVPFLLVLGIVLFVGVDLRSLGSRYVLWKSSLLLSLDYFWFGSGLETYYHVVQKVVPADLYLFERMTDIPDRTHNVLLDALFMRGVFGLGLWIFNIVCLVWILFKKRLSGLSSRIAYFSIVAYVISVQFSFSASTHVVFILGMIAVLIIDLLKFQKKKVLISKLVKIVLSVCLIFASIFSISVSINRLKTDVLFKKGISAYFDSYEEGLDVFDQSISASPQYAYLYKSIFILFVNYAHESPYVASRLTKYVERLGEITNKNFHYNLNMAQLMSAKGDFDSANNYFVLVYEQAPNWPILWHDWGEYAYKNGEYEMAIEKFERLLEILPPYWKWYVDKSDMSFEESEKARIYRKSNQSLREALIMLIDCYSKLGRDFEALELKKYL